ncbi:MAG TPA: hypothetical protein PLM98_17215 [Thiolinea sp.]|nr:hypothetical protein [Thiolinea sp.]
MKLQALFASLLVAGLAFGSTGAMAYESHTDTRTINLGALEARIDSGVATGKLTRSEERVLRSELKSLRSAVKIALKDHRLTNKEMASLERKESKLKSNIYKLSSNRNVARGYGYDEHRHNDHSTSYNNDHNNGYSHGDRDYNKGNQTGYQHDRDMNQPRVSINALPNGAIVHVK